MNEVYDELRNKWPSALVARSEVGVFSGGVLSPRYLANLDSKKVGPPRVRIGGKVAYPVEGLIRWMERRTQ